LEIIFNLFRKSSTIRITRKGNFSNLTERNNDIVNGFKDIRKLNEDPKRMTLYSPTKSSNKNKK